MVVGIGRDVIKFLALYASTLIAFALCFHIASNQKVRVSIYTDGKFQVKMCIGKGWSIINQIIIKTFHRNILKTR